VLVLLIGYAYLHALNTQGQFRPATEPAPTTIGNVLVAIAAIAGAAAWTLGHRRARTGDGGGARALLILGWALTVAGLAGDLVIFITLKAPSPLHAYASSIGLFLFYHAWHLIIGLVVMTLVLVRTMRGRITNREYIIEIVGWWLWWAAAAAVAVLVLTTAIA